LIIGTKTRFTRCVQHSPAFTEPGLIKIHCDPAVEADTGADQQLRIGHSGQSNESGRCTGRLGNLGRRSTSPPPAGNPSRPRVFRPMPPHLASAGYRADTRSRPASGGLSPSPISWHVWVRAETARQRAHRPASTSAGHDVGRTARRTGRPEARYVHSRRDHRTGGRATMIQTAERPHDRRARTDVLRRLRCDCRSLP